MTTIVGNKEKLVADSRFTMFSRNGDSIVNSPKLYRKRDAIIGTCGHADNGDIFVRWYGSKKKAPKFKTDEFEALVLTAKGLFHYDENCSSGPVLSQWCAIGTGGHAAYGALYMGATLEQAVEIACKVDIYSGEPIQTMKLETSE